MMNLRLLGTAGVRVSELCLGAMTFGDARGAWGASREQSRAVFEAFAEAGGNFIDTANGYQHGQSEALVGEFVKSDRDRFVIATKYTLGDFDSDDPNASGAHRKNLVRSLEGSLRRLGTDHVDLFWVHAWDGLTRDEEVLRALDDVVRAGKVHYIGFSDMPAWVISRSQAIAELRGWSRLAAVQFNYNLTERTPEREIMPMAIDHGLAMTPWGALASGMLSGKYERGRQAESGRLSDPTFRNRGLSERNFAILDEVKEVAEELGATTSQVALAWLRTRSRLIIPILGARTVDQLSDNLGCLGLAFTDAQLARLDAASAPSLGFPGDFLATGPIRKLLYGAFESRLDVRFRGA